MGAGGALPVRVRGEVYRREGGYPGCVTAGCEATQPGAVVTQAVTQHETASIPGVL